MHGHWGPCASVKPLRAMWWLLGLHHPCEGHFQKVLADRPSDGPIMVSKPYECALYCSGGRLLAGVTLQVPSGPYLCMSNGAHGPVLSLHVPCSGCWGCLSCVHCANCPACVGLLNLTMWIVLQVSALHVADGPSEVAENHFSKVVVYWTSDGSIVISGSYRHVRHHSGGS